MTSSTPASTSPNSEPNPPTPPHHPQPTPFHQFLTAHPGPSCLGFTFCTLLPIFLVLILQVGLGVNVINGDKITKIGLEIPDDVHQARVNAYETARQEADFGLSGVMCPRSEAKRAPLSLILDLGEGGNALTRSGLQRLADAEDVFMSDAGWGGRCALMWSDYPTCETVQRANTVYYPAWPLPYNVTDVNGCILPTSPVTLFRKYGDPTFSNIPGTISLISQSAADWPAFLSYVDKDFDATTNAKSEIMKSIVLLDVFSTDAWKGMSMVDAWDAWADAYNAGAEQAQNFARVMVYVPNAPKWRQTILLMPAAVNGVLLSLVLSWIVLVLACENWIIASLAILTISMIVTIVFGFMTFAGWGLGILEGILVVLVIGFSVDYTVHLSDSYKACKLPTRYEKVQFALESTGGSILSGAVSTVGAAAIMLTANIVFFVKFGAFIFLTIVLSTLFSLGFYSALLMMVGPLGMQGRLVNFYGGWLRGAREHMEKEQRAAKAEREAAAGGEMKNSV